MEARVYVVRSTCRSCESSDLESIFSFSGLPLASALIAPAELQDSEPSYPLDLVLCRNCALVQAVQTVPPSMLYDDSFRTFSSSSDLTVERARSLAVSLIHGRHLHGESFVIEIGSNDGYLLTHFLSRRVPVLGIDPAPGPAQAARRAGIPTLPTFFTRSLANHLREEGRRADVIVASKVLSQVTDLHGFLAGVRLLLKDDGVAIIDVPYVRNLVESCQFDTIHHEHLCYFSATAMVHLLASENLYLNHIQRLPSHGGSIRCYVGLNPQASEEVDDFLLEERELGMHRGSYYAGVAHGAEAIKESLVRLLRDLKSSGSHIVGYGAAAKGVTLLNYCGIGERYLDYVVDRNVHKQGRFLPGVQLAILPTDRLVSNRPDYALLLAWDSREEILGQQEAYLRMGGRFIVPLPEPAIV